MQQNRKLIIGISILIFLSIPAYIELAVEQGYSILNAYAVYHFKIPNPAHTNEMMNLNVRLISSKPAIFSHTSITASANLYPNINWRNLNGQPITNAWPYRYVLIFSGTECNDDPFKLDDLTCKTTMWEQKDGTFHSDDFKIQYLQVEISPFY